MTSFKQYLSTREAASLLGVSQGTIQKMTENGELKAWKTAGGHRRIPRESIDAALQGRHEAHSHKAADRSLSILIAEDDRVLQRLYQLTIARWNLPISLEVVDDGFAGILAVARRLPDILIADINLPGLDGVRMIRTLRKNPEFDGMDIVVVTALDAAEIAARGNLPADITVFHKPIPFHELNGYVRAKLAERERRIARTG